MMRFVPCIKIVVFCLIVLQCKAEETPGQSSSPPPSNSPDKSDSTKPVSAKPDSAGSVSDDTQPGSPSVTTGSDSSSGTFSSTQSGGSGSKTGSLSTVETDGGDGISFGNSSSSKLETRTNTDDSLKAGQTQTDVQITNTNTEKKLDEGGASSTLSNQKENPPKLPLATLAPPAGSNAKTTAIDPDLQTTEAELSPVTSQRQPSQDLLTTNREANQETTDFNGQLKNDVAPSTTDPTASERAQKVTQQNPQTDTARAAKDMSPTPKHTFPKAPTGRNAPVIGKTSQATSTDSLPKVQISIKGQNTSTTTPAANTLTANTSNSTHSATGPVQNLTTNILGENVTFPAQNLNSTTSTATQTNSTQTSITSTSEPEKKPSTEQTIPLSKLSNALQPLDTKDGTRSSSLLFAFATLFTLTVMSFIPVY